MTQGGNDPLTPLHRLSTASLSGVVRAFAYHRYFRFFLSLFFSTPLNEFFQIQAYLITDFDCWLCYFRYSFETHATVVWRSSHKHHPGIPDASTQTRRARLKFQIFLARSRRLKRPEPAILPGRRSREIS